MSRTADQRRRQSRLYLEPSSPQPFEFVRRITGLPRLGIERLQPAAGQRRMVCRNPDCAKENEGVRALGGTWADCPGIRRPVFPNDFTCRRDFKDPALRT